MHTTARHAGIRKSVSMQSAQANEWEQDERVRSSTTERNWHLQTGFFGIHSLQQFANFAAILSVQKKGTNTRCGHTSVATSRAQTCSLLKRGAVCVLPMSVPKDFSASKTDRLRCHHLQAGRFTAYYLALSTFSCQKNVRRSCNEPF